tara:strand:- start:467 stop:1156 length:690 start_codon:yes stop_codon:yes gene_type:complete
VTAWITCASNQITLSSLLLSIAFIVIRKYNDPMDNINDMQIGKAGEYLVCADLILNGFIAYPSEQGLPYDVVMDYGGNLVKVQVKSTRKAKNIPQRKTSIPAYIFHIGNNGKSNSRKKYKKDQVELFALVALDTNKIAYLPFFDCQTTMNFRVPEYRGQYHDEQAVKIKQAVIDLREGGFSCPEIAEKMSMKLSNVYKYSANISIDQSGANAGTYFDDLTLEKALDRLG